MTDMKGTGWDTLDGATTQFNHPWAVLADGARHLLIADMLNNRVVRLTMK
jgi:hypothetical protein